MSVENVKKFYEAVSQDDSLKQKFVELSQKYQGQPMDEARASSIIEQEALPLAVQMGYSFSMDDLKAYEVEMQKAKMNCELSDEELQAVVGRGTDVCVILGVEAGGVTGFCLFYGLLVNNNIGSVCIIVGATQG